MNQVSASEQADKRNGPAPAKEPARFQMLPDNSGGEDFLQLLHGLFRLGAFDGCQFA